MHHMGKCNPESLKNFIYELQCVFIFMIFYCRFVRAEIETYNTLDPGVRVVILKALCDIRVEVIWFMNELCHLFLLYSF